MIKQVLVEPPFSALNMTLPAFAAERQHMQNNICSKPVLSIDISCLQDAQQQIHQLPLLLSIDGHPTVT